MEEHYSRLGKQRFNYSSQKPEASVHSNALVTHSIPFPNHAVPLKVSNVSFPFDLYFSTRGVWNKNGKLDITTRQWISDGSDRLDWKRQQEFYFIYGLLYHSIDICFSISVLDVGVLFFKGSLPRLEKVLILDLISYRSTIERHANSPLNKSLFFCWTMYKNLQPHLMSPSEWNVADNRNNDYVIMWPKQVPRGNFTNTKLQISGFTNASYFQKVSHFSWTVWHSEN